MQVGIDSRAKRASTDQQTFADQQLVGPLDRAAGKIQILGQISARRQAVVGAEQASQNLPADLLIKRFIGGNIGRQGIK